MAFTGFPKHGLAFFQELASRQDRDWFKANKDTYEALWVEPMEALFEACHAPLQKALKLKLQRPKLFRIHRDVRFSANKEPYKTHCAGLIAVDGEKSGPDGIAAVYLQLGLEGFGGAGQYGFSGPQLVSYRKAVANPKSGAALARLISALEKKKYTVEAMKVTKRVPRGFDEEHPRAALLKLQGLVVGFPAPPQGLVHTPRFAKWVVSQATAAAPLVRWIVQNVKG